MDKTRVTAVINTLNEQDNLPFLLRSLVTWVDEIVVVDMESTDDTLQIAQKYGARTYTYQRLGYADPARAFAISKASNLWILMLDADEIVTKVFSEKVREIVNFDLADVVVFPWVNYLLGDRLQATGWGIDQDFHPRLFKSSVVQATGEIHNFLHFSAESRILTLAKSEENAVIHFNYVNSKHFLEKMNRYTSIEALQLKKSGAKTSYFKLLLATSKEFVRRFLVFKGYKDGWRGVYLSLFMVFYKILTHAKLEELNSCGDELEIKSKYAKIREKILEEFY